MRWFLCRSSFNGGHIESLQPYGIKWFTRQGKRHFERNHQRWWARKPTQGSRQRGQGQEQREQAVQKEKGWKWRWWWWRTEGQDQEGKKKKEDEEDDGDGVFDVMGDCRGDDNDDQGDDMDGMQVRGRKPKKRPSASATDPKTKKKEKTSRKGSKTKGRKHTNSVASDMADSMSGSMSDSELGDLKEEAMKAIQRAEMIEQNVHPNECIQSSQEWKKCQPTSYKYSLCCTLYICKHSHNPVGWGRPSRLSRWPGFAWLLHVAHWGLALLFPCAYLSSALWYLRLHPSGSTGDAPGPRSMCQELGRCAGGTWPRPWVQLFLFTYFASFYSRQEVSMGTTWTLRPDWDLVSKIFFMNQLYVKQLQHQWYSLASCSKCGPSLILGSCPSGKGYGHGFRHLMKNALTGTKLKRATMPGGRRMPWKPFHIRALHYCQFAQIILLTRPCLQNQMLLIQNCFVHPFLWWMMTH